MSPTTPPSPALLLDASGPLIQTGLWIDGRWDAWESSREEAGKSIFTGVSTILAERQIRLDDLRAVLFCEGPGSMLGIRIASMAVRGWQTLLDRPPPVFLYNSHALLARILLQYGKPPPFHIISDARRQRWNLLSVSSSGEPQPLRRVETTSLAEIPGPFFRIEENIRSQPPVPAETVPYDLAEHASLFVNTHLLRPANQPDVLLQEAPEYKKWSSERHRSS